jgi:hypothetical protein
MPADRDSTEAAVAAGVAGLRGGRTGPMAQALRAHMDKYERLKQLFDEINKADNHIIPLKQISASK